MHLMAKSVHRIVWNMVLPYPHAELLHESPSSSVSPKTHLCEGPMTQSGFIAVFLRAVLRVPSVHRPANSRIDFDLSEISPGSSPALNPNSATPIIDLSMVYGTTESVAYSLRKPDYLAVLDFSIVEIQGEPHMFLPLASQIRNTFPAEYPGDFERYVPTLLHPQVKDLFAAGDVRYLNMRADTRLYNVMCMLVRFP